MPQQISFAQAEYDAKRKTARRDRFLGEMEQVVPWAMLLEVLAPYYYALPPTLVPASPCCSPTGW